MMQVTSFVGGRNLEQVALLWNQILWHEVITVLWRSACVASMTALRDPRW